MGGFLPTAAMSVLQLGLDTVQKAQQADISRAAQESQAQAQIAQIRQTQEIQRRQRNNELKRAIASQRARFGSQGIGTGGSANAVLSGLAVEAEKQDKETRDLAMTRISGINNRIAIKNTRNLLEASQPAYRTAFGLVQQGLRRVPLLEL